MSTQTKWYAKGAAVYAQDGTRLACLGSDETEENTAEDQRRNTILMAAAPELLEALESILFFARGGADENNRIRICKVVQAAIEKATGR